MKNRTFWIDNLRSFLIILVVAHHVALAYRTNAFFNKAVYIFSSWVVVDDHRWVGMERFIHFNDIIFMALMFFISGLFVTRSLQKKGTGSFLKDRFNKLFVTFLASVSVVMLIAHYPSFVLAHEDFNIRNYIVDFFTVEYWPSGSAWFIWVLFVFNLVFALLFKRIKGMWDRISGRLLYFKDKPFLFFLALFALIYILYFPLRMQFGGYTWTGIGPFHFQKCTLLMYFGYFLLGSLFGHMTEEKGLLSDTFSFLRKWPLWTGACLIVFALLLLIEKPGDNPLNRFVQTYHLSDNTALAIYCIIYVATNVLGCLAYLSLFKRLANYTNKIWDSLATNSFAIYLVHYMFVLWAQYAILQWNMPAIIKFFIVFLFAFLISWYLGYVMHKNRRLSRYI